MGILAACFVLALRGGEIPAQKGSARANNLGATLQLSREGRALLPMVIAENATAEVKALATELVAGLERITGAKFAVTTKGKNGLFFGTDAEWPGKLPAPPAGRSAVLVRDDYLLRSEKDRVWIIGRTPVGLRNAVWDFLYRAGFRQYFPGEHWAIWPRTPQLSVKVDTFQTPAYYSRYLFLGGSQSEPTKAAYEQWKIRNRMDAGFKLKTQHSYGATVKRNPAFFAAHPETLVGPPGENTKFDPSHAVLLDLLAKDAIEQFRQNPELDSISCDPSDGSGWRKDSPLGSPSNQAVTISNQVARAIQKEFPGRRVGMYAYAEHSPPPDFAVDPHVIVSVATNFLRQGHTVEKLLAAWSAKGAEMGIREYLGVWPWDHDIPGRSRAAKLEAIAQSIPHYHRLGARYWTAETSQGWGAHGLGNYLAARVLWDLGEAKQVTEILHDFYARAFGAAAAEMKEFYESYVLASGHPLMSEDLLGRMYRCLERAGVRADSAEIRARIEDLVVYTRFAELVFAYENTQGAVRLQAYGELADYSYRMLETKMISSYGVLRSEAWRHKELKAPVDWNDAGVASPPANQSAGSAEISELVRQGIARNPLTPFEARAFPGRLGPAHLRADDKPRLPVDLRGTNNLYVYKAKAEDELTFTVRGGLIYGDRGPVQLRLFSELNALVDEPVSTASAPGDKQDHVVTLRSPFVGVHRLEIADGSDLTKVSWPAGRPVVMPMSPAERTRTHGKYSLVFFVPADTKSISGYSEQGKGSLQNAAGETVFDFAPLKQAGYFSVPVPNGLAGTWCRLVDAIGVKLFMTVPPYLARSADELLVPEMVLSRPSEPSETGR